jgi:hypothetical protein
MSIGFSSALYMVFLSEKITRILISIGLTLSIEDPCIYIGFVHYPNDPNAPPSEHPISLGLYTDNFVYFSEDPAVEDLFYRHLGEGYKVDFMGIVEWFFLRVHFL